MQTRAKLLLWTTAFLLLSASCRAGAATLLGPIPYTGFAGSPFDAAAFGSASLEDFEDGLLNTPGATATTGGIVNMGALRDSVEATPNGFSFISVGTTVITFELATLPTWAGIVWTDVGFELDDSFDGVADVLFEAFGPGDVLLGVIGPAALGDGAVDGGTAEDRFFGVIDAGGIARIRVVMPTSADFEVDHLQYGFVVPEPDTASLVALGLGLAALRVRRAAVTPAGVSPR